MSWTTKYLQIVTAAGCLVFLVGVILFVSGPWGESGTEYDTWESVGLGCILFGGIVMLVGGLLTVLKNVIKKKSREDRVKYGRLDR